MQCRDADFVSRIVARHSSLATEVISGQHSAISSHPERNERCFMNHNNAGEEARGAAIRPGSDSEHY
jgi:hypothetical protein